LYWRGGSCSFRDFDLGKAGGGDAGANIYVG
jgi:hypothetical protein